MVMGLPERSSAVANCLRKAQARVACPKPLPGSRRMVTDLARPSGPTVTVSCTTALSMPSMSASGGNPQSFQAPPIGAAARDKLEPAADATGLNQLFDRLAFEKFA